MKIRIGTRGSDLALKQVEIVSNYLRQSFDEIDIDIITITTTGDRIQDRYLKDIGGKGLFSNELEFALLNNKVDILVHSGKDLPSKTKEPFSISAVLPREISNDIIILNKNIKFEDINLSGLVIGTSSSRREYLIKKHFDNCSIKMLRGNVPTRLEKLRNEEYDAIILAYAGIARLDIDISSFTSYILDIDQFTPASCQGIIACEALKGSKYDSLLNKINDDRTMIMFECERYFMELLNADCHDQVGVNISYLNNELLKINAFYNGSDIKTLFTDIQNVKKDISIFSKEFISE